MRKRPRCYYSYCPGESCRIRGCPNRCRICVKGESPRMVKRPSCNWNASFTMPSPTTQKD